MFQQIIAFSIRYKLFVAITTGFLILGGLYAMLTLPVDAVPDITNNQVQVVTVSPTLAPQEVEKLITSPIEISMSNILNVTEIRSISRFGLSVVTVVFKDKVPVMLARQMVNEQLQTISGEIPPELGSPQLMPITTGLGEIFQYTLEVKKGYENRYSPTELRTIQDWIVKRQLSGIPGIVEISSFGGYLKQYEVAVDPAQLRALNLTISDVYETLSQNNQNTGGSYIEKYNSAYYIRAEGMITSLSEIEQIAVTTRHGVPIRIRDVAQVKFGHANRFGAMTKNGKGECVGGITLMFKGANATTVTQKVKERVARIQQLLPEGISIEPYLDRSELVQRNIRTVIRNLAEGALIVFLVLLLFLGNLRAGLIVASVIPLSMLFAFICMRLFDVSANLMSLGAIDFGIIVDGSIIIVESILVYLFLHFKGKHLQREEMDAAVAEAAGSIAKSAAFAVFIILIVFFPILTLTGIEGKMFLPMAQTLIFAIIGALVLSLTYIPMMASRFLNRNIQSEHGLADRMVNLLKRSYEPVLRWSLHFKYLTLGIAFALFVLSLIVLSRLGGEFLPNLDEGDFAMQMTLPPGSSLTESMELSTRAEQVLLSQFPEIEQVVSKIGTAEVPTDPMAIEDADIMIVMKPRNQWVSARTRPEMVEKMKEALKVVTGADFNFSQPIQLRFNELMTGAKSDIAVKLYGEDMDELYNRANEAAALIAKIEGASDVKVEQVTGLPQLVIHYDREKLSRFGLSIEALNTTVRAAYAGEIAGVVYENERKFDLVVRLNKEHLSQIDLNGLLVSTPDGTQVPLGEVAEVSFIKGPMQINRDDTKRRIVIGINVRNTDVENLVAQIHQTLEQNMKLKPGYYFAYGGQFENLKNAKKRLSLAIPIALGLIMLLLFFTFNSLKYAVLIFSSVPLSAIGGILALAIRGIPFSISAGVGFIALFGVAVLNGIVLINHFNTLTAKNKLSINQLVTEGSVELLRPVFLTGLVASLGFVPMAISTSAGSEVQRPLATVVIGGLIVSTLLTMIVIPVLYKLVNSQNLNRKRNKLANISTVLILLLMLSTSGKAQTNSERIISLDRALELAVENDPRIKNAAQYVELAKTDRLAAWELGPTSAAYTWGQINSEDKNDTYFEINQSFGSLVTPFYQHALANKHLETAALQQQLVIRQVEAELKQTWYTYLYNLQQQALYTELSLLYEQLQKVGQIRFQLGDIELLEKTLYDTQVASMINRKLNAQQECQFAALQLKRLCYSSEAIVPVDTSLQMMQIVPQRDSSGYFASSAQKQLPYALAEEKNAEWKIQKSKFMPEWSVGYFNQKMGSLQGLQGWQVGVSVPLWFVPQQAAVKKARIESERAYNEAVYNELSWQYRIDELTTTLDKQFRSILYYHDFALKQSDELIRNARLQFEKEEIDVTTFIQTMNTVLEIKTGYLESVYQYNLTAIQLEWLAY